MMFFNYFFARSPVLVSHLNSVSLPGEELGISHSGTAVFLVILGITDSIGRFSFGFLFDISLARNRRHFFLAISGFLCGNCKDYN